MPKISVIVPVYNAEKYLKKCLDSIINQTYQDFEIIIINDGSTDKSESIIKQYQEKYLEKIKYFKEENKGLSEARNLGVKNSQGDYIGFVDSDDYIDERLFESLLPYMEKGIELIKFKLVKVDENYKEIERISGPIFEEIPGQEAFAKMMGQDVLIDPACLYLYKTTFFKNNNFEYKPHLYHEDFGLTPIIITKAHLVVSTDFYGYYYVQASDSITRNKKYSITKKRAYDLFKHYNNMIKEISGTSLNITTINNLKQYYTNAILLAPKDLKVKDKNEYIKEIKKRKLIRNIRVKNIKQLLKKILLCISIKLYLKMK